MSGSDKNNMKEKHSYKITTLERKTYRQKESDKSKTMLPEYKNTRGRTRRKEKKASLSVC